jgi:hypothetical protein
MPSAKEHHFGLAKRIVSVIIVGNALKAPVQFLAHTRDSRGERFAAFQAEIGDSIVAQ